MDSVMMALKQVSIESYIMLCSILFAIGITGVLLRRNAIIVLMSIEIMLNSVNLLLAAFSAYKNDPAGQVFVFFIMVVAAAEVAVGLAMIVMTYRNSGTIDIKLLNRLKW